MIIAPGRESRHRQHADRWHETAGDCSSARPVGKHSLYLYPSTSGASKRQNLPVLRQACNPTTWETRQEVLLKHLPDGLVEQPSGSGQAESIL